MSSADSRTRGMVGPMRITITHATGTDSQASGHLPPYLPYLDQDVHALRPSPPSRVKVAQAPALAVVWAMFKR